MRNMSTRVLAAVTAGAMLGTLVLTGAGAPQAAGALPEAGAPAASGTQLWVSRYNGPGRGNDDAAAMAASPDGKTVFITGNRFGSGSDSDSDYLTIAYRAATGARLWARHYQNGSADQAGAVAVAVSPAGLVFVTGTSQRAAFEGDSDYATIAYRG